MEIVMSGIAKAFGTNQVLRDVSITLKEGEVHALMGENGAGKSTLMNILTGIHKADAGKITIDGVERTFPNPREAELNGVAFIHQELNIWPNLTLLENLYLMRPKRNKFGMLDKKAMLTEAENTCRELGIELPLTTEAGLCSVGHQQMTEILRILMLDAKVVIMDEPTAALTERETATLFKMMRKMKARGVAIVYISHRMEEVFSECDTITVMRDGHTIITKPTAEISVDEVVRHMVGRSIDEFYPARTTTPGEVVMSVDNLKPEGFDNEISFSLRKGEILGVAGLMGAGRTEIMRAIFGVDKHNGGTVTVNGSVLNCKKPEDAIKAGIAFITENRKSEGLILDFSIGSNITLPNLGDICPSHVLNKGKLNSFADELSKKLGVKTQSIHEPASSLSGGNQQKVVIAKWVGKKPSIIIMDEPTAALTERETATLFKMMRKMKARGVAIVYISHRMEEVFSECDTITVMRDGHTIITKPTAEISVDEVVRHMVGRSIDEFYPARTTTPGEVVMSVDNLKPEGFDNEISFSLRKGEILGVAGLMGAGRTEIMRAIFGVDKHNGGTVTVNGSVLNCKKPEDAIKAGIAFITENRKSEGLILDFSIGSNITLPNLGEICPSHVLDKSKLNSFADELSKKLGVKTQSIHEPASSLSGGNQQKVVIAKWVGKKPSIIIMDEPTRGIDIGAKRDIYDLMNELTNDGVSIIMVSSELPEVLGMSDRVMVIHEGRVAGILDRCDATPESIMTLATGGQ